MGTYYNRSKKDKAMIWFTSDLHFGHKGILNHVRHQFQHVQDMDRELIAKWNEKVAEQDVIWILGDFSFHRPESTIDILKSLKGRKFLIKGNHDKRLKDNILHDYFMDVRDLHTLKVPDPDGYQGAQRIVLCHYAMRVWERSHYGSWQLYGHSHGSLKEMPYLKAMDVGVDTNNLYPYSYDEIKERMKSKVWLQVDHHVPREGTNID